VYKTIFGTLSPQIKASQKNST